MALFVLGAGATRGCSFVNPAKDPCLPPLDGDFFTQLQRVRNPKHRELIQKVIKDVVDLFGPNFDVTLETVFTTLEHTIRMLDTTGENRDFRRVDLAGIRDRLVQAIAVAFEDSLMERGEEGSSKLDDRECKHHTRFVKDILCKSDNIISFNYDCVIDYALRRHGSGKWNAHYGYGFNLGSRGKLLTGDDEWQPDTPASRVDTIHLHKLHGSLHFYISSDGTKGQEKIALRQRPYTKQAGKKMWFSIIPPEWHKAYDKGTFALLWQHAAAAINRTQHVVLIGYSLPATDLHSSALFRTSIKRGSLKSLVVVNPDPLARRRTRTILQRGFHASTKVLSFDTLEHFVAAHRSTWEI